MSDAASTAPPVANWTFPSPRRPSERSFALQIHPGERRRRRRRSKSTTRIMLVCTGVTLLTAAVSIASNNLQATPSELVTRLQSQAMTAFVEAGFGLDQVSITGHRRTKDSDIFDALDLPNVATLMDLDMAAALKRIERISWVDTAQMTRAFPGALDITVRERVPAAVWQNDDRLMLIDATGRVLGPVADDTGNPALPNLPRVAGQGGNVDIMLLLTALRRYPSLAASVAQSERIGARRWRIVMTNGSAIELGPDREIEGLDRVASSSALSAALSRRAVVVDVRAPGRSTIRPAAAPVTSVKVSVAQ